MNNNKDGDPKNEMFPDDLIDDDQDSDFVDMSNIADETMYEHHRYVADPKQTPLRIDKFLFDRIANISRNKIQDAINDGYIRVDGKMVKPNFKVKPGHSVTLVYPKPPDSGYKVVAENIPLDIRYEDDDIIIVHKEAGMVVHPGVGNYRGTLVNALAHYMQDKELPIKEGNLGDRPGLVHRIDKNTSGLLVIAKTEKAMSSLSRQFFHHTVHRRYQALVWGAFPEQEGTINLNVGRNPNQRLQMVVFPEGKQGKRAVTHYKTLEDLYYVSLIQCELETGRTHQIRVHMQYQGHPLFNDTKYGGGRIVKGTVFSKYKQFVENCFKLMPRHALHAKSLGFIHPTSGKEVYFESDLPDDMSQVLNKWRTYLSGRKRLL